jgi:hypothetical protein
MATYGDPNVAGSLAGPAVTVQVSSSGNALVTITALIATYAEQCFMGFAVSGATTVAASDSHSLNFGDFGATNGEWQGSANYTITGLSSGSNTFTAKYRANNFGGSTPGQIGCDFLNTQMIVTPY